MAHATNTDSSRPLSLGLVGQKFMGRAHSNAVGQVGRFFDLPRPLRKSVVVGRDAEELEAFAARWGWESWTTNWRDLLEGSELDLVDLATPNHVHAEHAIALLEAGVNVACEKPLAGTLDDARAMRDAARKAKALRTYVWFNYRRCPAVAFAWQLMRAGRIGRVYHVRATYLQNWGGPDTPLLWRFQKDQAGSGAHGDLNAHIIDMARFLLGEEVTEVHGAVAKTFVEQRVIPGTDRTGASDVDDALLFLASFQGGAVASFEASRVANPHQNANSIEINGELGSLRFDFEDMNRLQFCDASDAAGECGWRSIMCTKAGVHPYAENWWPDAHLLGYEHTFTNMLADVARDLAGEAPVVPLPDFADAYETQRVMEAAVIAARERRAVELSEVE